MGTEIESLDTKLEKLDKFLLQFREKFKLSNIELPELDIAVTIPELKKLSPDDLMEKAAGWKLYVLATNILADEIRAKLTWVEYNWERYAGIQQRHIDREYGYTAYDRRLMLLENDEYAQKLYRIKMEMEIQLSQIGKTPSQVNYMAELAMQFAADKRREKYGNYRN